MVKLTSQQAHAVVELNELVNRYSNELDVHHGKNMGTYVTEDCEYGVLGAIQHGRAAVEAFYANFRETSAKTPIGVPIARHLNINVIVDFSSDDAAVVRFNLLFFTNAVAGSLLPDPLAVADVEMKCRREADGHWRIASMDATQPFKR